MSKVICTYRVEDSADFNPKISPRRTILVIMEGGKDKCFFSHVEDARFHCRMINGLQR